MSQTEHTAPVEPTVATDEKKNTPPPPCHIKVTRNEVDLGLKNHKILKGKRADTYYPAPEVTAANLSHIQKWMGEANFINMCQTYLKRTFQTIAANAVNSETGLFDEALFVKYAEDFTTSGLKLKEINDKLDELQAQLTRLIDAGEWVTNDEKKKELQDLNAQVRAYRQMKEDRQRKPKADEDEESSPAVAVE